MKKILLIPILASMLMLGGCSDYHTVYHTPTVVHHYTPVIHHVVHIHTIVHHTTVIHHH